MSVDITIHFTPPNVPDLASMDVGEASTYSGALSTVTTVTDIGTYPNYKTSFVYTSGSSGYWYAIRWRDNAANVSSWSDRIQAEKTIFKNMLKRMMGQNSGEVPDGTLADCILMAEADVRADASSYLGLGSWVKKWLMQRAIYYVLQVLLNENILLVSVGRPGKSASLGQIPSNLKSRLDGLQSEWDRATEKLRIENGVWVGYDDDLNVPASGFVLWQDVADPDTGVSHTRHRWEDYNNVDYLYDIYIHDDTTGSF